MAGYRWNLQRVLVSSDLLRAGLVLLIPVLYVLMHSLTPVFVLLSLRYEPVPVPRRAEALTPGEYLRQVREGWAAIYANSRIGLALATLAAVWLAGGYLHVAGKLHLQSALPTPGLQRLGLLMAVLGLGSAASAWWLNTLGRHCSYARCWSRPRVCWCSSGPGA